MVTTNAKLSSTLVNPLPLPHVYRAVTAGDRANLPDATMRLDEPFACTVMNWSSEEAWVVGAWEESRLVGTATVTREQIAGPPMRGVYRVCETAVSTDCDSIGLIEQCIAYVAANGGRSLWCHVPLSATNVWGECGFTMAGEPLGSRNSGVSMLMMRTVMPSDHRYREP